MRDLISALRAMASSRPLRSALADLSIPDERLGAAARRGGTLSPALGRLADEHAVDYPGASVGSFLAWLAATVGDASLSETDTDGDCVELSTFHRAKGLEWPAVALVGLEDGLVPIAYATTAAARAEERRLLYVAITRAEQDLWCSWARERQTVTRSWTCRPSPFLDAVEAAGRRGAATVVPGGADRIAGLRQQLPAAG
jgi:DNA helicase-2/ATP-dependent DNA helicase PcrA